MECSENVGDRENQSKCCGNEEIQFGGAQNQSDPSWTKDITPGEILLYSGHEGNPPHTPGIALMLSKKARKAIMGWESQ